jgi:Amt family ammonium transporter
MPKRMACLACLLFPVLTFAQTPPAAADCRAIRGLFDSRSNSTGATALESTCQTVRSDNSTLTLHDTTITIQGSRISNLDGRINDYKTATDLRLTAVESRFGSVENTAGVTKKDIRRIWVLLAAVLVFLMQAGFKCLEVGAGRAEHSGGTGLLNLSNWVILCLVYWMFGFALMFGKDWGSGFIGTTLAFPDAGHFTAFHQTLDIECFLFQLAFAATAATIVDGALAERVTLGAYFVLATVVGILIYPVFGHWAWGGAVDGTGAGWLNAMGFKDFAGSTVVHSVGAWIAWAGVIFLGPRRYRFGPGARTLKPFNLGYSVLGVFLLWFGWWGFNGGSLSKFDDADFIRKVASVILHTNLAGGAAGLAAYWSAGLIRFPGNPNRSPYEKMIGGTLGGLVAITASADTAHPLGAIGIGLVAGLIHNVGFELLIWLKHDDVAGAIPVHGFCGVWGTLCAAFGTGKPLPEQIVIQILGIGAALLWTWTISAVVFWALAAGLGLRVPVTQESLGDAAAEGTVG